MITNFSRKKVRESIKKILSNKFFYRFKDINIHHNHVSWIISIKNKNNNDVEIEIIVTLWNKNVIKDEQIVEINDPSTGSAFFHAEAIIYMAENNITDPSKVPPKSS